MPPLWQNIYLQTKAHCCLSVTRSQSKVTSHKVTAQGHSQKGNLPSPISIDTLCLVLKVSEAWVGSRDTRQTEFCIRLPFPAPLLESSNQHWINSCWTNKWINIKLSQIWNPVTSTPGVNYAQEQAYFLFWVDRIHPSFRSLQGSIWALSLFLPCSPSFSLIWINT